MLWHPWDEGYNDHHMSFHWMDMCNMHRFQTSFTQIMLFNMSHVTHNCHYGIHGMKGTLTITCHFSGWPYATWINFKHPSRKSCYLICPCNTQWPLWHPWEEGYTNHHMSFRWMALCDMNQFKHPSHKLRQSKHHHHPWS